MTCQGELRLPLICLCCPGNPKCREFLGGVAPVEINLVYLGESPSLSCPSQEPGEVFLLSLCQNLNRSVGRVPHPAGQLQPLRQFIGLVAKTDVLDLAGNFYVEFVKH